MPESKTPRSGARRVAVTGASGFMGRHLLEALTGRGYEVVALSRSGKAEGTAAPGRVVPAKGDVTTSEGLSEAFRGADAVVHLVGIIRERRDATFERVHVEGTRRVLAAAEEAGVGRFLHMSALGASADARSGYSRTKASAESLVKASGFAWTIFRPSLAFGPGDDFFGNVLKSLVTNYPLVVPQIGRGDFPFRPIWVGDVAEAFAQSLEQDATVGRAFELVGPEEYSFAALLNEVQRVLGSAKPRLPVPLPLMRLAVPAMQILPAPPITRDEFTMLLAGNTADPAPMNEAFTLEWRRLEDELPQSLTGKR